jgi:hypothetical protein
LHAHPHELKFGYPKKYIWPPIDLSDRPDRWFEILFEENVVRHFRYGYKKMEKYKDTLLFIFLPSLQKGLFLKYFESIDKINHRFDDILLTPTFNKIPIKPITSFKLENPGIMISALERYKTLAREELYIIEELTGDAYTQVLSAATSIP